MNVLGTVVDVHGVPVVGANVMLEGSSTVGVTADADGNFTLDGIPVGATLNVSFLGYLDKKIAVVDGMTTYRVVLEEDKLQLDEIVVVGYGVQKKVNMTGAISNV